MKYLKKIIAQPKQTLQHQSFIGFLHVFGQEGNIYQFHPFNDGTSEFPSDVLYYLATAPRRAPPYPRA